MKTRGHFKKLLKPRKRSSHKGDFGRIFILAGSKGMIGAAYLASMGAIRAGAGLVTLGVPETVYSILAKRHAEVMVKSFPSSAKGAFSASALAPALKFSKNQDVIAIGPGLSVQRGAQSFARGVISKTKQPLVIDADGINALSCHESLLGECAYRSVLTPHPGEFKRLFGEVSTSESDRKKRAVEIAKKHKVVLLLKGNKTVVADPRGDCYVNQTGNPGMATGGSGDVLTGIIAALIGQGLSLFDSACLGAYLHGLAGDLAAKKVSEVSLIAGDIPVFLSQAIKKTARG